MKRTPLKRKTGLRSKTPLKAKNSTSRKRKPKRRTSGRKPSIRLLKSKLWNECKRIIRARHGNTCYTCYTQGLEGSNWQTGHFIPSSVCSVHMRYSLNNLRPQCMRCNIHLSGNWIEYEKHLRADGIDTDELKKENEETKNKQYDRLWYEDKIAEYRLIHN